MGLELIQRIKKKQKKKLMHIDYETNDHMKVLHIKISPIISGHMHMTYCMYSLY